MFEVQKEDRITILERMEQLDTFTLRDLFRRKRLPAVSSAIVLLFVAYMLEHVANKYAFTYLLRPTSLPVGDIVLDNIPVVDLNFLIVEVALVAIVVSILFLISRPRYILFTVKAFAIFVSIRAISISLTHVGMHPDHIVPGLGLFNDVYRYLNFQTGLFFSGHTGLPILMACIFWKDRIVRYAYLTLSVVFACAVLLAHVHYSIDVFAAPFIAYSIFVLAQHLFVNDYRLITGKPPIEPEMLS
jgi:hypothetical protein